MAIAQQIFKAAKQMFGERKYIAVFVFFVLLFFGFFIFIPVKTIPGNALEFQLSILQTRDWLLMGLLAFLIGLNFAMNIYIWRKRRRIAACSSVAGSITAGVSGAFASVIGTATCASCLTWLFSFIGLGFGSALFVLKYQAYFLLGAVALVLLSLYFTARKINNRCTSC